MRYNYSQYTDEELDAIYEEEKLAIMEWHEEHGAGAWCDAANQQIHDLYEELFGEDED